jgi:osmotically-inducible protein OsmY
MTRTRRILVSSALALGFLLAQGTPTDDRLYDQVRVRLAGNRDVGGAGGIQVEVKNGVVTLKGKVESERQKNAAEKVAKKTKGVTGVKNELRVEPK